MYTNFFHFFGSLPAALPQYPVPYFPITAAQRHCPTPDARIPIIISDALLTVLFYNIFMKKKPLSQTNPFLLDRDERRAALIRTTVSSSAIEGIRYSAEEVDASMVEPHTPEKLKKRSKSGESRR